MENIPVFSNRLDESNGIVENVLEMKITTKKTPWHLRFAPKAKGLVSFVQNLLSPLTRKEGVRGGQLSAFFQSAAAAVVVGIGLLVGSTGEVHGQGHCDPPIDGVCFHKKTGGDWSSAGRASLYFYFDGKSDKRYEFVWRGLKRIQVDNRFVETYDAVSQEDQSGDDVEVGYHDFWWPSWITEDSFEGYGCDIYEGYWDYENVPDGEYRVWVRGDWAGSVHFYSYQEAAQINLDPSVLPSGLPSDWWKYYCEIDWDQPIANLRYGYILGLWTYDNSRQEFFYGGDHGSPRFDYDSSCSYEFSPRKYVGGFSSI